MSKLHSVTIHINELSNQDRTNLFNIFEKYYSNVNINKFQNDLSQKDYMLILYDNEKIVGFSTISIESYILDNEEIYVVYSGDTIVEKEHWGQQELVVSWLKFINNLYQKLLPKKLYWLLICKGDRTYRYLNLFAKSYYPNHKDINSNYLKPIRDYIASQKFPGFYNTETGIIEFNGINDCLKPEWANNSEKIANNAISIFFENANPGHSMGNELVCLAEVNMENFTNRALSIINK